MDEVEEKYRTQFRDEFYKLINQFKLTIDAAENYHNNIKGLHVIDDSDHTKELYELSNLLVDQIVACSWNLNNIATIEKAIKSVLNQNYQDIEYIIVDGNSTDGTQEIIESYRDRISQYISEPDKGMYDAINKGLKLATGDVIGLMHSDDEFYDKNDPDTYFETV